MQCVTPRTVPPGRSLAASAAGPTPSSLSRASSATRGQARPGGSAHLLAVKPRSDGARPVSLSPPDPSGRAGGGAACGPLRRAAVPPTSADRSARLSTPPLRRRPPSPLALTQSFCRRGGHARGPPSRQPVQPTGPPSLSAFARDEADATATLWVGPKQTIAVGPLLVDKPNGWKVTPADPSSTTVGHFVGGPHVARRPSPFLSRAAGRRENRPWPGLSSRAGDENRARVLSLGS